MAALLAAVLAVVGLPAQVALGQSRPDVGAIVLVADGDLYFRQADGGARARVSGSGNASFPAWSPDGSKLAFVRRVSGASDICIVNRDGSGLVRLTDDTAREGRPSWSPDGSQIAFARRTGASDTEVSPSRFGPKL